MWWRRVINTAAVRYGWRGCSRRCGNDVGVLLARLCSVLLYQPLDFESFSYLQEGCQLVLSHIHLSSVHVLQDGLNLCILDVLENDYWVATRQVSKQTLEVRRAGSQHHLVALNRSPSFTCKSYICECLILKQLVEYGQQVAAVIIPPQAVLLRRCHLYCGIFYFTSQSYVSLVLPSVI